MSLDSQESLNTKLAALENVILSFSKSYNLSPNEISIGLSYILRRQLKNAHRFTKQNIDYAPQSLTVNKIVKTALNDCISEIDKNRNTFRSITKELRKR